MGKANPKEEILNVDGEEEVVEVITDTEEAYADSDILDPLEALLAVDTSAPVKGKLFIERLKTYIEFEAPVKGYEQLIERCQTIKVVKRTHQRIKETDFKKFNKLLIFQYVTNPDLRNPKLQKHYGVSSAVPEDIVERVFLPGERDALVDAILTLGGYTDDVVEEVKN